MIFHLCEACASVAINVLLRIVASTDTEEAKSSNLVTPTINEQARAL